MSTKRSCMSEIGPGSKRLERSSAAASRRLRNAININHLTDDLLAEILSRLPCSKLITQCKSVYKRWGNLMSQHSLIVGFLCHQSGQKQTPPTLVSGRGEEFLTRMSCLANPLDLVIHKIWKCYNDIRPVVVATFNDLVLCCSNLRHYYICNPFTNHWVTLPPPPPSHVDIIDIPVGFMCDLPYCMYGKKNNRGEHVIRLNSEYNCNVVRFFCPLDKGESLVNEFKVQIFSSDTRKWRELTVSSPKGFKFCGIGSKSVACNGMLYWMGDNFLIGLDPFMIEKRNSSTSFCTSGDEFTTEHNYQCHFIEIDKSDDSVHLDCFGVYGGCLKLAGYNLVDDTLCVCDLNADKMARIHGEGEGTGKLSKEMVDRYSLDLGRNFEGFVHYAFDPSDGDVLYMLTKQDIFKFNIRTRRWSKMIFDQDSLSRYPLSNNNFYPLVIPLWPTPLPHTMKSVTTLCKYGCDCGMTCVEIREHEKQCPRSPYRCVCPKCEFEAPVQDLYDHFSSNHMDSATLFDFCVSFSVKLEKNKKYTLLRERSGGELFILKYWHCYEDGRGKGVTLCCIQPSFMRGFWYEVKPVGGGGNGRPLKLVSVAKGITGVYEYDDSGPPGIVIPSAFLSSAGEGEMAVCIMGHQVRKI